MRAKIKPIHNKQLLDNASNRLRKMNEAYYIIFQLILETGMPLENIPNLLVKDLKDNQVSFQPSHKNVIRTEYISNSLQRTLKAYAGDRKDSDYAFYAVKDSTKKFPIRNFQKALLRVSESLDLEVPITALALRKTYILNVFLKEHNYQKIYALTECRSVKGVLEYLDIEVPGAEGKYLSSYTIKDALIAENLVNKTKNHINKVFDEVNSSIDEKTTRSYEYYSEVMKLLTDIESSLTRYESLAKNQQALDDIYSKSHNQS